MNSVNESPLLYSGSPYTLSVNDIPGVTAQDADSPVDIFGGGKPDSTDFNQDTGTLSFIWNNENGLKVQTNWSLESYGRTGLHSNISITGTAVGSGFENKGIEHVRFPIITGFGYPYVTMYRPDKSFGFLDDSFPMEAGLGLAINRTTQTPGQRAAYKIHQQRNFICTRWMVLVCQVIL